MPDELGKTSTLVLLTAIELERLKRWARFIEASEQFPVDAVHIGLVAKLERYSKETQ